MKKTILPFFILVMCLGTTSSWAQNPASPAEQKATFESVLKKGGCKRKN